MVNNGQKYFLEFSLVLSFIYTAHNELIKLLWHKKGFEDLKKTLNIQM